MTGIIMDLHDFFNAFDASIGWGIESFR